MCCGRGYDTTRVKQITKCECKFKWCCAVECKDCEEAVDIHTCKAPKRAEWLDQTWGHAPSAPCNATPPFSPLQDILWNMAFWESLSKSTLRLCPPAPTSVHHCMAFLPVSVKALEFSIHQYELIPISPCMWMAPVTDLLGTDAQRWNQWTLWVSGGLSFYQRFSPDGLFFLACGSGLKWFAAFIML